jgi:SPP1 gp7 family putative phage head morphogenesis protein
VLENGLQFEAVGVSPDQVLALEYPARLREEICACYGVPPALVGVYDDADYANARAQRKLFWEETVSDYLLRIAGAINEQIAWQFPGGPWRVRFDLSGVEALQEDQDTAATRRREDVRAGLRTINEVRKEEGLEPVPWGDQWWGPLMTVPLAGPEGAENVPQAVTPAPAEPAPKPEEEAPAEEEDEEEAAPKASPILSIKAAPKRLSPAARRRVSLAFNRQRAAYIPPIREGVGGWYDDLAKEVLANLRAANPAPVRAKDPKLATLLFNVVDAGNQLFAMLKPIITEETDATGREMLATIGIDTPFDMPSARLQELLASRDFAMRTVAQDAHDRVYASLAEGLANAENMQQLTERVLEFAQAGKEQYAETVARTEAGIAANEGSREAYWQADAVGLEWVAVGDDKTRDTHAAINGATITRGEMFDLDGTPCTGPGDPTLPAEEICNCRCTTCPVF